MSFPDFSDRNQKLLPEFLITIRKIGKTYCLRRPSFTRLTNALAVPGLPATTS
jgi:hypothetical protein